MMRRSMSASFLPGAYVFPGGVVDSDDAHVGSSALVTGLADEHASRLLGVASGGLSWWVAAVRECFEEAGLLIATDHVRPDRVPLSADQLHGMREALLDGSGGFADVLRAQSARIAANRIIPWSRWVTPMGGPRRFDTRFFVTSAPIASDGATHDEREMSDLRWFSPSEALADPNVVLITPTLSALRLLQRSTTVEEAIEAAQYRHEMR
jgi:8-oxo-dGTP pyrophosphatase MutT (NUDIX family)